jgi:tetratricopeptide (TPR) repeat protein
MSNVTVELPESLKNRIEALAAAEGYSVSQFLASAASEKLAVVLTTDYLRREAAGRREDFERFLAAVPEVPPPDPDRIDFKSKRVLTRGCHVAVTFSSLASYRRALRIEPNSPEIHNNLGVALYHRREFAEARVHYDRAFELQPTYLEAAMNLGLLDEGTGDLKQAETHYARAPNRPVVLRAAGGDRAGGRTNWSAGIGGAIPGRGVARQSGGRRRSLESRSRDGQIASSRRSRIAL